MEEQGSAPQTADLRQAFEETDLCLRRVINRLTQTTEDSVGEQGEGSDDEALEKVIRRSRRQIRANRELLGPVKGKADAEEEAA